jgi:hypothetical protein
MSQIYQLPLTQGEAIPLSLVNSTLFVLTDLQEYWMLGADGSAVKLGIKSKHILNPAYFTLSPDSRWLLVGTEDNERPGYRVWDTYLQKFVVNVTRDEIKSVWIYFRNGGFLFYEDEGTKISFYKQDEDRLFELPNGKYVDYLSLLPDHQLLYVRGGEAMLREPGIYTYDLNTKQFQLLVKDVFPLSILTLDKFFS